MTALVAPSDGFLDSLRGLLGPQGWRGGDEIAPYLVEPRGRWRGRAAILARPSTVEQVAEILRRCTEARAPVIPYGGGTGLVGGQVAPEGPPPVLLSLERMNAIRRVDPIEDAMIVEAGVVLAAAQAAAAEADRLFPLSLAAEGSARIGGILACNAGGVAVLRYGNARDLTLGVEAALPDGSIYRGLKTLRKDNMGYDLRDLLIGAEGTLGVITAAALRLHPRPREVATAFCAVPDPDAAGELLRRLRDRLGPAVSAFELLAKQGMDFLAETCPEVPRPPVDGAWFALIEATGGDDSGVRAGLEAGLMAAWDSGLVLDAAVAQSVAQRAAFWRIREDTPEANRRIGAISNHDISAPLAALGRFIAEADAAIRRLNPRLRINCFGHVGDGNLHYNVFPPVGETRSAFETLRAPIKRTVHDLVHAFGGSIAAEHGVGRYKTDDLLRYGDPGHLRAMRAIKAALDPAGIMNPGAVLPAIDG